ncbi:hypothetical protein [Baekduia sp. Peel2402]|uniref:hypothetical protein n=1 Tax=Baekduia sp. Peel2402 TaxID=3458296 RepID=UPI00403EBE40
MVVLADSPRLATPLVAPVDERAARRSLRAQIARLERELGEAVFAAFPHLTDADVHSGAHSFGPRLLGLGDLERVRDELAERVHRARVVVAHRADLEADSRALLEEMLRDPQRYRHTRIPLADLGERGCGVYSVQPRLGIVGRCMGWWQVKLSSGCPRPAPA